MRFSDFKVLGFGNTGDNRLFLGGFRQNGGGLEENPLKRCLEGVIRYVGWV